jgi:hypothetical protein
MLFYPSHRAHAGYSSNARASAATQKWRESRSFHRFCKIDTPITARAF